MTINTNVTRINRIENEYNAILNSFLKFEFYYTAKLFRYKKCTRLEEMKNVLHECFGPIEKQVYFGLEAGRECGQVIFDTKEEEEENAKFQNEVVYNALIKERRFLSIEETERILDNLKNSIIKKLSDFKDDCIKNYKKLTLNRYCTKWANTDYNKLVSDLCKDLLKDWGCLNADAEHKLCFLYTIRKEDDKTILTDKISIMEEINKYEEKYEENCFFDCS